jgi:hypothetical protein
MNLTSIFQRIRTSSHFFVSPCFREVFFVS